MRPELQPPPACKRETGPGGGRRRIDNAASLRHFRGMAKPALGRGLGALLGESPIAKPPVPAPTAHTALDAVLAADPRARVQRVPLDRIRPCPLQPRKDFPPETLRELADSIREQGIVQPLIVRERDGHLELIAGERRWRAAQLAGQIEVPVILRQADDQAVLALALIENLQRKTLTRWKKPAATRNWSGNFISNKRKWRPKSARAAPPWPTPCVFCGCPPPFKRISARDACPLATPRSFWA